MSEPIRQGSIDNEDLMGSAEAPRGGFWAVIWCKARQIPIHGFFRERRPDDKVVASVIGKWKLERCREKGPECVGKECPFVIQEEKEGTKK